ncbi:Mg chelatase, subunit ChlI [Spirochaeta thermophila DSM 6578]|uniref:Mg chelatase, subunit ChlI n=1 Tax=Winmispira thermophila (strain ATCC 700085 / DSM 6578 / Z-1203) TaxID=869211 RepID=G0G9S8_WINT7|nr:YifB family Mg chelatase-like AAA ATPase [Spirochaeta thermophila]AEJ60828.1 Mg chelatase, subunit ChlI [Spirochaeta thermophila DSM 6578]
MQVVSFLPWGYEGIVVRVEVDIRKGIPGVEVVGFAGTAVKEARERIRVALKNSGFAFPQKRVLINLAPAGLPKKGAWYDLAIALALLAASGQVEAAEGVVLVMGELRLSGEVLPVEGVLSSLIAARREGVRVAVVPAANVAEATVVKGVRVFGVGSLEEAVEVVEAGFPEEREEKGEDVGVEEEWEHDFSSFKGQTYLRRALEVAAAGGHHVFLFGPPGSGKTMGAYTFPSILPPLSEEERLEVLQVYSLAGELQNGSRRTYSNRRPFRAPHHSATVEGMVGGGKEVRPGEISLAHQGVLFMDEAPEFRASILQSLREPIETGRITLSRAGHSFWYPARFQLILAANPCPCGNLGREGAVCACSVQEIKRYWRKIGAPLLDRIDIRFPVSPESPEVLLSDRPEPSAAVRERVERAWSIQRERFAGKDYSRNASMTPEEVETHCRLGDEEQRLLLKAVEQLSLSSRACASILKLARTIADLEGAERIQKDHLLEAVHYRRYGDMDFFWSEL